MGKLSTFLFFIFVIPFLAGNAQDSKGNDFLNLESIFSSNSLHQNIEFPGYASPHFKNFSTDPDNKILDDFNIPKFFVPSVQFWFYIYTSVTSDQMVIHDKNDIKIIYTTLDFSELSKKIDNKNVKFALQNSLAKSYLNDMQKVILQLKTEDVKNKHSDIIYKALKRSQIMIPATKNERAKFYEALAENLRTQTGQKDNIQQGIWNIYLFDEFINSAFEEFQIPSELTAIPFLESSFNIKAKSKVGAAGAWQFMPSISKHFMTLNSIQDDRLNPLISTISALNLLRQNKQILKNWDLAVPAYNSGTKHLLNGIRKVKKVDVKLEDIIVSYEHPHLGFASQNFYSEFLALVYALAYRKTFFDVNANNMNNLSINKKNLDFYLSLCPFKPSALFQAQKSSSPELEFLNQHLRFPSKSYPKGTIIVSDSLLPKKSFFKVSRNNWTKLYPKNWKNLIKNQSCSTR